MRKMFKQAAAALAGAAAMACAATTAQAVEGAVQYPHGAEGFYAGALPPPGTYFLAYGIHYQGELQNSAGDTVRLPGGGTVDLEVNAIAPRIVHMTDKTLFGGQYGMHAVVPFFRNTLSVGGASDTNSGLGDITINPFILAWHRPDLHYAIGLDINIPTGKYDTGRRLGNNIGANYWSFEPLFAVTWLPGDGWELNGKFMYNTKLENPDTDVQSGDEIHVDYTIGKQVSDKLTLGVGGYWVHQLTDDTRYGVDLNNEARVFAIGPQVKYQAGATSLIAKFHHEVASESAFEGDRVILKMVTPF
ncbi:transporter [Novispirillum sp. DQ9]|uniref:SphA family protein n=1 Tax=Novispirillum sp. DQ9 TaxID=3398612 RepID=UPI003C7A3907